MCVYVCVNAIFAKNSDIASYSSECHECIKKVKMVHAAYMPIIKWICSNCFYIVFGHPNQQEI